VFVGEMELVFDLLLNAGEDVAVDVVDEVEGGEEDESCGGSGDGGGAGGFGRGSRVGVPLRGRIAGVFWWIFSVWWRVRFYW
jgi:hypothetical protein